MSTYSFVFLCIQACLIQNAFGQYLGYAPAYGLGASGFAGADVEVDLTLGAAGSAGINGYGLQGYPAAIGYGLPSGYATGLGLAEIDIDIDALALGGASAGAYGLGGSNLGLVGLGNAGYGYGLGNAGVVAGGIGSAGLAYGGLGNAGLAYGGINNAGLAYGEINNAGLSLGGLGYGYGGVSDVAAVTSLPVAGPFVSNGNAEIVVGGDFAASGTTLVAGQVPVLGVVSFGGSIPASGVVSIAGNCGCAAVPL